MSIVSSVGLVIGGVDTHRDTHVAAVLDGVGSILGTASFETNRGGYAALLQWLASFGQIRCVGVEGTGAYGAGLARFLREHDVQVEEVGRPDRQARRKHGKSDHIDAIEAERAVMGGRGSIPRSREGAIEAIRVLLVARRSAREARLKAVVQMRHLVITAPDALRKSFEGCSTKHLVVAAAALRPGRNGDLALLGTKMALNHLARRTVMLDTELAAIDAKLATLVAEQAPALLELVGVGPLTAATLLVTAGLGAKRIRSEAAFAHLCGVAPIPASSGKVTNRYRLDKGGDRQANSALWRIVLVRMNCDPATRAYTDRKLKEGRSKRDTMRLLKRYTCREVYRTLRQG